MLAFAVVCVAMPDLMLIPYAAWHAETEFETIRATVVTLLRFVAAYSFFDAMAIVFSSAVRGAGDTRFPLIWTLLCCWLLMVVPTWLISTRFGGNLLMSWFACTVYIVVVGTGLLLRFQSGRWKSMSVIEPDLIRTGNPAGKKRDAR